MEAYYHSANSPPKGTSSRVWNSCPASRIVDSFRSTTDDRPRISSFASTALTISPQEVSRLSLHHFLVVDHVLWPFVFVTWKVLEYEVIWGILVYGVEAVRSLSGSEQVKTLLAGTSPTSPMRRRLPTPLFPTKGNAGRAIRKCRSDSLPSWHKISNLDWPDVLSLWTTMTSTMHQSLPKVFR